MWRTTRDEGDNGQPSWTKTVQTRTCWVSEGYPVEVTEEKDGRLGDFWHIEDYLSMAIYSSNECHNLDPGHCMHSEGLICGTLYQDANVAFRFERSIQGKQSICKPFLINLKKALQIRIGKNTTPKTLHSSAMIPLNPLPSPAQRAMISRLIRCRAIIDLVLSHRMNSWRTQWMYYPNPTSNYPRSFEVWNPLYTISFMNPFWPNLSQYVRS